MPIRGGGFLTLPLCALITIFSLAARAYHDPHRQGHSSARCVYIYFYPRSNATRRIFCARVPPTICVIVSKLYCSVCFGACGRWCGDAWRNIKLGHHAGNTQKSFPFIGENVLGLALTDVLVGITFGCVFCPRRLEKRLNLELLNLLNFSLINF